MDSRVCKRCRNISWKSLEIGLHNCEVVIEESIYELQQSRCRICRLLGYFFLLREAPAPSYQPSLCSPSYDFPGPHAIHSYEIAEAPSYSWIRSTITKILLSKANPYSLGDGIGCLHPEKLDFQKVRAWIKNCKSKHPGCSRYCRDLLTDLKLIDCEKGEVVNAPYACAYVALSYVWGSVVDCPVDLSSDKLQDAPRTIVDAMALTKDLGYKYLWVDRYCIAQQDAEVKHIQIAQMGKIYATADLTIIAAIGSDPTHGLPGFRESRSVRSARLRSSYISVLPASDDLTQIVHSPWSMRAWTLQESILSRRRLILTGRQAMFLCNTQLNFEAEDDDSEHRYEASAFQSVGWLPPRASDPQKVALDIAQSYLIEYSKRALSYDADALDAIVGALNTLMRETVYHTWGVPFAPIHQRVLLSWSHSSLARRRPAFPSWSPLGWVGAIDFQAGAIIEPSRVEVTVRGYTIPLTDFAPKVSLLPTEVSQKIAIRGESYAPPFINGDGVVVPFTNSFYYVARVAWSELPSKKHDGSFGVKVLLLRNEGDYSDWFFVLKRLEQDRENTWERIGFGSLPNFPGPLAVQDAQFTEWLNVNFQAVSSTSIAAGQLRYSLASSYFQGHRWFKQYFTEDTMAIV